MAEDQKKKEKWVLTPEGQALADGISFGYRNMKALLGSKKDKEITRLEQEVKKMETDGVRDERIALLKLQKEKLGLERDIRLLDVQISEIDKCLGELDAR